MKHFKLTFVLTILMSMVGVQAFADWDTSIRVLEDGVYYYLDKDNLQAQVTFMPDGKYAGDIEIPDDFIYAAKIYSVTSIGENAFSGCTGLTSITIGKGVTDIGDNAFSGCSGLTSVTLNSNAIVSKTYTAENNMKTIFGWQVTKYVIGDNVTSIGDYAFYGNYLTSVTIGNSVTSIGESAFEYCFGLTSINIPNSVRSIGSSAFYGCSVLTSVTIGNGVTSIGSSAFYGCSDLSSVSIGNSVTTIGESAFSGCFGLTSVTLNSNAIVSKTYTRENNINNIFGEQVTKYVIGDNVKSIGESAFAYCDALSSVSIGNSVTSIETEAFYWCPRLISITIGNSVTSIGENAFFNCYRLSSITIPNSVTSIGVRAFENCSKLTSVIFSGSITSVGIKAFYATAWYDKQPNGLIYIDKVAYKYKGTMVENTDIVIKNGTTTITREAFYGCSGLTSVDIPNSVTSIGDYAFEGCSGLTSITIPNSVTSIGACAFYGCSALTSVTIGNSVKSIGKNAFYDCKGLKSLTIGSSVTSIGERAFEGCSGLTSVTALNPNPIAITQYVFTNRENATLYVPKGSKDAYKAAAYWKEFKEIIEIEITGIDQINFQENGEQGIDQEGAVWYTIDGKRVDKPKKGINIIRMNNGTTKKVVVK